MGLVCSRRSRPLAAVEEPGPDEWILIQDPDIPENIAAQHQVPDEVRRRIKNFLDGNFLLVRREAVIRHRRLLIKCKWTVVVKFIVKLLRARQSWARCGSNPALHSPAASRNWHDASVVLSRLRHLTDHLRRVRGRLVFVGYHDEQPVSVSSASGVH